mmetsp:Transcript_9821/g.35998  ORF Transcript_9821/g.35998 Transcript_9821/m.35998 type:complete len:868 (-) Transcript_9821:100-2703(-)
MLTVEEEDSPAEVRVLLVDNYDSYTYNLFQLLAKQTRVHPHVIYNDTLPWSVLKRRLCEDNEFDCVVISPGPGTPARARDVGVCMPLLQECPDIPVLGVCLGHQLLAHVHGATVERAPEPVHGRTSDVVHDGSALFNGIPSGYGQGFSVVRYHSLHVREETLPECLRATAWVEEGSRGRQTSVGPEGFGAGKTLVMGLQHQTNPHYGVQFHPESICTAHGERLLSNFLRVVTRNERFKRLRRSKASTANNLEHRTGSPRSVVHPSLACDADNTSNSSGNNQVEARDRERGEGETTSGVTYDACLLDLHVEVIDGVDATSGVLTQHIFETLFANDPAGGSGRGEHTFWLDSSKTDDGRARFSFMGGRGGPLWRHMTFTLEESNRAAGDDDMQTYEHRSPESRGYHLKLAAKDSSGAVVHERAPVRVLDTIEGVLAAYTLPPHRPASVPFPFLGGLVGYLGYEVKSECLPDLPYLPADASRSGVEGAEPLAGFFFVDRFLVFDHLQGCTYAVALSTPKDGWKPHHVHAKSTGSSEDGCIQWINGISAAAQRCASCFATATQSSKPWRGMDEQKQKELLSESLIRLRHPQGEYRQNVSRSLELISAGETYEVCLTTALQRATAPNPLEFYLRLRNRNPAPYAGFLHLGDTVLCCSSPERFLRLDHQGALEAKPIKGTIARGNTPQEDERNRELLSNSVKDRSENLMIVDLLRNDLGRVCEVGSVHCPSLMAIESFASVHQMVSTVRGQKRKTLSAMDCIRATFPGGSMTGAPKLRTVQILEQLEGAPRGAYSGSMGFFSLCGALDLNIIIRTLVAHRGSMKIGAGGAVVALSDPEEEFQEMLLKAERLLRTVEEVESLPPGSLSMGESQG